MWNTNGFPTKMIYKQWIFMDFPLLVAVVYLRVSHSCADDMRYALTCSFLLAKSLPDKHEECPWLQPFFSASLPAGTWWWWHMVTCPRCSGAGAGSNMDHGNGHFSTGNIIFGFFQSWRNTQKECFSVGRNKCQLGSAIRYPVRLILGWLVISHYSYIDSLLML